MTKLITGNHAQLVDLSESDKSRIFERLQNAERRDAYAQISGLSALRLAGAGIGIVFLLINAYQGAWALKMISSEGGGSLLDNVVLVLTAIGLVLAANVIAVRLAISRGLFKIIGFCLLLLLMSWSIFTSALHLSMKIQSGADSSVTQSQSYQDARQRITQAEANLAQSKKALFLHREAASKGSTSDFGWLTRPEALAPFHAEIQHAENALQSARDALAKAKESSGTTGSVLAELAGWFGLSTVEFSTRFALATVVLMELARVFLSVLSGLAILRALRNFSPSAENPTKTGAQDTLSTAISAGNTEKTGINRQAQTEQKRYDNTPSHKRRTEYQTQLAKVTEAVKGGHSATIQAIRTLAQCGTNRAQAIQSELVEQGVIERKENRRVA